MEHAQGDSAAARRTAVRTIFDHPLLEVIEVPSRRVVIARRKLAEAAPEEIMAAYHEALTRAGGSRQGWGLVVDVRDVVGRNDASFERGVHELRQRLAAIFPRFVVLVKTQVGAMQAERMSREAGRRAFAAFDLDEAVELAAPKD